MPLYEFECKECKENFEKLVRIAGVQNVVCPQCGSAKTHKKLSLFAVKASNPTFLSGGSSSDCAPGGT
jgi:putative FmdB family regulatory protein